VIGYPGIDQNEVEREREREKGFWGDSGSKRLEKIKGYFFRLEQEIV
jgi:hypothetical protein